MPSLRDAERAVRVQRWDGLCWEQIDRADVDAWAADLRHHAAGGGESLEALWHHVRDFMADAADARLVVVTHGGWIHALGQGPRLEAVTDPITAASWLRPPAHGESVCWERA